MSSGAKLKLPRLPRCISESPPVPSMVFWFSCCLLPTTYTYGSYRHLHGNRSSFFFFFSFQGRRASRGREEGVGAGRRKAGITVHLFGCIGPDTDAWMTGLGTLEARSEAQSSCVGGGESFAGSPPPAHPRPRTEVRRPTPSRTRAKTQESRSWMK
ncbi:hypothetical protein BC826DRAFT_353653 [Russula brevipes]|nr:hypothetical protein BC826DRAFT_353653 [Russula brevipes]